MGRYSFKRLCRARRNLKLKQKYLVFLLHYQKSENYINIKIERRHFRKLARYIYGQTSSKYTKRLSNHHQLMITEHYTTQNIIKKLKKILFKNEDQLLQEMEKFTNFLNTRYNLAKNDKQIQHSNRFRNKREEVYSVIKNLIKQNKRPNIALNEEKPSNQISLWQRFQQIQLLKNNQQMKQSTKQKKVGLIHIKKQKSIKSIKHEEIKQIKDQKLRKDQKSQSKNLQKTMSVNQQNRKNLLDEMNNTKSIQEERSSQSFTLKRKRKRKFQPQNSQVFTREQMIKSIVFIEYNLDQFKQMIKNTEIRNTQKEFIIQSNRQITNTSKKCQIKNKKTQQPIILDKQAIFQNISKGKCFKRRVIQPFEKEKTRLFVKMSQFTFTNKQGDLYKSQFHHFLKKYGTIQNMLKQLKKQINLTQHEYNKTFLSLFVFYEIDDTDQIKTGFVRSSIGNVYQVKKQYKNRTFLKDIQIIKENNQKYFSIKGNQIKLGLYYQDQ